MVSERRTYLLGTPFLVAMVAVFFYLLAVI